MGGNVVQESYWSSSRREGGRYQQLTTLVPMGKGGEGWAEPSLLENVRAGVSGSLRPP